MLRHAMNFETADFVSLSLGPLFGPLLIAFAF